MTINNPAPRILTLLLLLCAAPASVNAADVVETPPPASTKPCFIVVNEKLVFDGSKVTSIEVLENNFTSRIVSVNLGGQRISIAIADDVSAVKYLSDLVLVIQKSCR